jgi:LCP family protein required for cell wall assembly
MADLTMVAGAPVRPRPGDIGSGVPDISEQAERTRRAERGEAEVTRSQRIDETLIRMTAAHAGLALPGRDAADDDEPGAKPRRRRPALPGPGRLAALVLAVLVFGASTVGWATQSWLGAAVRDVAALDTGSGAIVDADAQKGAQNVLVVATVRGPDPGSGPQQASPRPDTVVVAHVPAGGGPMTVLSVPADLEINRPPCERFDPASATYTADTVPAQARTRLATALDMGGPRCATRVVQQLTGLAITQYVGLDLDRLGAVVDAVSGVRVCVTQPVLDRVLGPVIADAGTSTLDGAKASDFVRAADVEGDPPADLGRIERQQQVLAGVLEPTLTSTGLLDVPRIAALRPVLGAALTSDGAGLSEILALSLAMRSMSDVTFTSVPTTSGIRDTAVLRDADAAALFSALRKDTPLPAAATDTGSTDTGPAPGDLTVELLNASGRTGLAAGVGDTLRQLGFGVGTVSNAARPTPQTVIRYSPDQAAAADLLAGTVPSATTVPDPGASGVLQLVLGRSFDEVLRAPTGSVAPAAAGSSTAPAGCS